MDLQEKMAAARAMRADGATFPAIARHFGVAVKTARRWTNPKEAERDRSLARAYKAANREKMREYDARYDREHRAACVECGGQMGIGVREDGVCTTCCDTATKARDELVVRLWNEGRTTSEIRKTVGYASDKATAVLIHRLREEGHDLAYRQVGPSQPGKHARLRP